jgi:ubiquinone/menaquinone biosynthesis C-methylase UbiE
MWSHNIHYHRLLLKRVPEDCRRALDVGCGEGAFARELAHTVPTVVAVDIDPTVIELAQRHDAGVEYVCADFLELDLEPASFDYVVCIAALHHMDARAALRRMAEVLRPGGVLAVLGLARSRFPTDAPRELAAVIVNLGYRLVKDEIAPHNFKEPAETYVDVCALAQEALPGADFRRHLLWRYSIAWRKP